MRVEAMFKMTDVKYSISKRRVILPLGVDDNTALQFKKALEAIISDDDKQLICVFLNCRGGMYSACFDIYHQIQQSGFPVFTIAYDYVESGGAFITQAGGKRFIASKTKFRFHRAEQYLISRQVVLSQATLQEKLRGLALLDGAQFLIFTERGRPVQEISELFENEALLSASRACRLSLFDKQIKRGDIEEMHRQVLKYIASRW